MPQLTSLMHFSHSLWQQSAGHSLLFLGGASTAWKRLPREWKHHPAICHGLIQTALELGEAPEHLQCIDDVIVWGNTAEEAFEKGKKIIQILLKARIAIKKSKVSTGASMLSSSGIISNYICDV